MKRICEVIFRLVGSYIQDFSSVAQDCIRFFSTTQNLLGEHIWTQTTWTYRHMKLPEEPLKIPCWQIDDKKLCSLHFLK